MTVTAFAAPGSHVVQFYERDARLHRTIVRFFDVACRTGSPAIMISRRRTFDAVVACLGADPAVAGRIQFVDAEIVLDDIMRGQSLDHSRAAAALDTLCAGHRSGDAVICVYGEMVDVLCKRGQRDAAIALETVWNDRCTGPRFAVMCGYDLAGFGGDVPGHDYRAVCAAHTHVLPAEGLTVPIVYVIDDDESMRRSLARLIGSIDVAVETYPSAEAFLATVDRGAPGCLLLDIQLDGMSGTDLQALMAAEGWRLPIIAMSGLHDERMEATALRLGAIKFLHKPFDADALFDALELAETEASVATLLPDRAQDRRGDVEP